MGSETGDRATSGAERLSDPIQVQTITVPSEVLASLLAEGDHGSFLEQAQRTFEVISGGTHLEGSKAAASAYLSVTISILASPMAMAMVCKHS
jgi:hypothetical protein